MSGVFGTGGLSSAAAVSSTPSQTIGDLSKDVALNNPPEDTTSDVAFSPTDNFLAASSWDKKVRIYQYNDQGQSEGKFAYDHENVPLAVDFSKVSEM